MTVTVTLQDGRTEEYMRFGDAYRKHSDGTLDVVRTGVALPISYAADEWAGVEGDEKRTKRRLWH